MPEARRIKGRSVAQRSSGLTFQILKPRQRWRKPPIRYHPDQNHSVAPFGGFRFSHAFPGVALALYSGLYSIAPPVL